MVEKGATPENQLAFEFCQDWIGQSLVANKLIEEWYCEKRKGIVVKFDLKRPSIK